MKKRSLFAIFVLASLFSGVFAQEQEDEEFNIGDPSMIQNYDDVLSDEQNEDMEVSDQQVLAIPGIQADQQPMFGDEEFAADDEELNHEGAQDEMAPELIEDIQDAQFAAPTQVIGEEKMIAPEVQQGVEQRKKFEGMDKKKSTISDIVEIKLNISFDTNTGQAEVTDIEVVQ